MSEIFMCKDVSSLMRPQRIHVVSIIQKTNLQIFVPHIKTFNIPTLIQKTFFLSFIDFVPSAYIPIIITVQINKF